MRDKEIASRPSEGGLMARNKYSAVQTEVDGIRFASKKEAKRYWELKLLERAGEIVNLALQPEFVLRVVPGTVKARLLTAAARLRGDVPPDLSVSIGKYRGDFEYRDKDGQRIVEDVKGFKTPLYRWKKKHVEAQYGIEIREV